MTRRQALAQGLRDAEARRERDRQRTGASFSFVPWHEAKASDLDEGRRIGRARAEGTLEIRLVDDGIDSGERTVVVSAPGIHRYISRPAFID